MTDQRKYKTVLRIGPVRSLHHCKSITNKMELFLDHLFDFEINDYQFAIENDLSPFYITVELAVDKIEDGIESMLTIKYLQFKDKILSKYLKYEDYAIYYCPYVPITKWTAVPLSPQEIKILKSRKL